MYVHMLVRPDRESFFIEYVTSGRFLRPSGQPKPMHYEQH